MEGILIFLEKMVGLVPAAASALWRGRNGQPGLLEAFRNAVEREDKHAVVMLFWRLHGIRMDYGDILALIHRDDFLVIMRFFQRRRRQVCFRNCTLQYAKTDLGKSIERAICIQRWFGGIFCFFFCVIGAFIFIAGKGLVPLAGLAFISFWVFLWFLNEESARLDKDMVDFIESESSGLAG